MARTDIHCPSRIEPKEYSFVAMHVREFQYAYSADFMSVVMMERTNLRQHMDKTNGRWARHAHGGSCMICGAHAIYLATFYHQPTNEYVCCGMDCAEKLGMGDRDRFRRLKDSIAAAQKGRAGWKKAEGMLIANDLQQAWDVWIACHKPDVRTYEGALRLAGMSGDQLARVALRDIWEEAGLDPDAQPVAWGREETIICDIVKKMAKYGTATSRQFNYLGVLCQQIQNRPQSIAAKQELEAKRAAEKALVPDVEEGRRTFRGEVIKVDTKTNQYGTREVMTVKTEEGWVLWGSVPSGIQVLTKGDRVQVTGTISRSDKDPKFGFFSRPVGEVIA